MCGADAPLLSLPDLVSHPFFGRALRPLEKLHRRSHITPHADGIVRPDSRGLPRRKHQPAHVPLLLRSGEPTHGCSSCRRPSLGGPSAVAGAQLRGGRPRCRQSEERPVIEGRRHATVAEAAEVPDRVQGHVLDRFGRVPRQPSAAAGAGAAHRRKGRSAAGGQRGRRHGVWGKVGGRTGSFSLRVARFTRVPAWPYPLASLLAHQTAVCPCPANLLPLRLKCSAMCPPRVGEPRGSPSTGGARGVAGGRYKINFLPRGAWADAALRQARPCRRQGRAACTATPPCGPGPTGVPCPTDRQAVTPQALAHRTQGAIPHRHRDAVATPPSRHPPGRGKAAPAIIQVAAGRTPSPVGGRIPPRHGCEPHPAAVDCPLEAHNLARRDEAHRQPEGRLGGGRRWHTPSLGSEVSAPTRRSVPGGRRSQSGGHSDAQARGRRRPILKGCGAVRFAALASPAPPAPAVATIVACAPSARPRFRHLPCRHLGRRCLVALLASRQNGRRGMGAEDGVRGQECNRRTRLRHCSARCAGRNHLQRSLGWGQRAHSDGAHGVAGGTVDGKGGAAAGHLAGGWASGCRKGDVDAVVHISLWGKSGDTLPSTSHAGDRLCTPCRHGRHV
eukprot:scaffold536_cov98-Isochrysis_galbana.AAC.3